MNGFPGFVEWLMDQVGYAVCHQEGTRCLVYGGRCMPVCARDAGLYLAFLLTTAGLFAAYRGTVVRYPGWKKTLVLAVAFLPLAVDAVTSYAGLRESNNVTRLLTGALAGAAGAALLFPLASRFWLRREPGGTLFGRWWMLAGILLAPGALYLATRPDWSGAWWFWGVAVTLAVIFALFELCFVLLSLIFEWARRDGPLPRVGWVVAAAAASAVALVAAFNGLHRLADRFL